MNQATVSTSIVQPTKSESTDNQTRVLFKLAVQVRGVKRRCRKSDTHFFHLGHVDYTKDELYLESIKDKVRACLDTNMKEVHSVVRVHLDYVVIKNEGTYTVTQWEPFNSNNIRFDFNY
jgi:hypothetical protein